MNPTDYRAEWLYRCEEREAILTDGRREPTPQERSRIAVEVDGEIQKLKREEANGDS